MSLESAVAALSAACTALLALPQQITNLALAKIADIGAAYTARINTLSITRYVNQGTGADTNSGLTADAPYKTLARAIGDAPRGALVEIVLCADHTLGVDVAIDGRTVRVRSDGAAKRILTAERYTYVSEAGERRGLRNFRLAHQGALLLQNIRIVMPALGTYSGNPDVGQAALFTAISTAGVTNASVNLQDCEVSTPSSPFGPLFRGDVPWTIAAYGLVATDQPIAGRLVGSATNTAGTAANTLAGLLTNLATV